MSENKALRLEVKDADQGAVQAVFATLNVVDHDNDVTLPGAFKDGQEVRISAYGHASWGSALPVGKGVIREDGDRAILDGQFFLDTTQGRDTFATIKALGGLGEWSYGFDVADSEPGEFEGKDVRFLKALDVHEVSPVLLGAGIDTATLSAKTLENKAAIAPHSTATSDAAWDGPTQWNHVPADRAELRAATAWVDPNGDPNTKAAYKFIHHEVSGGGDVGAANVVGCIAGIAVLNGGRGGTTIPDADKKGVYAHLARHLRDAGRTPPDFNPKSLTLSDQAEGVLGDVLGLVDRAQALGSRGAGTKEGRVLSSSNHQRLTALAASLLEAHGSFLSLLDETNPEKQRDLLIREFARFQRGLAAV